MKQYTAEEHDKWFKGLARRVSSAAMALENEKGEVLIVKANYKDYWTFPGGVIDDDETPLQAAARETAEEVGLTVNLADATFAWVASRQGPVELTYQFVFKAPLPVGEIVLQATEIDEAVFVSKEEILSKNRSYATALHNWAAGKAGYTEQTFGH